MGVSSKNKNIRDLYRGISEFKGGACSMNGGEEEGV
jgi:hypothetical protein